MTILFTCPHCGTQTDVHEEFAGRSGPCAVCGKSVTVPYPSTAVGDSAPPATHRPAGRLRRLLVVPFALRIVLIIVAGVAAASVAIGLLFALAFPAISTARRSAQKSNSASNMSKLAMAMLAYEADQGCFPPAYVADADGKPMHSWRVLLLPYLGYDHIYERYDFSAPWDSPQNMAILAWMPDEFACPADLDARAASESSYMVIVGDETMFPGKDNTTREQITDGGENTIMLVQTLASGVCWLEPRDLAIDQMRFQINGRPGVEIGSNIDDGAYIATADGSIHFLTFDVSPYLVRAMTTIDGNELIPWHSIE